MSELLTDRQEVFRIIGQEGDEAVQCRNVEGSGWQPVYYAWLQPELFTRVQWRRKPAPKRVPLGPEDVPPGSALRCRDWQLCMWKAAQSVGVAGTHAGGMDYEWSHLMETGYEISRDGGKTWKPCWKESGA